MSNLIKSHWSPLGLRPLLKFQLKNSKPLRTIAAQKDIVIAMKTPPLLVFTDMDGSLLDHYSYSHQPADAMLKKLEDQGIPVIANTSKTFDELIELRRSINNRHPLIAENGAVVYLPKALFAGAPAECTDFGDYWVKEFCPPRSRWQSIINSLTEEFSGEFSTFEQGGIDAIIEWTGLSEKQARLAAQRRYGEPVRWFGSDERAELFIARLRDLGASVLQGGRFIHVSGQSDKGLAMQWLAALYMKNMQSEPRVATLAIGDGPNDIAMLEVADFALIIRSPANPAPKLLRLKDRETLGAIPSSESGSESESGPRSTGESQDQQDRSNVIISKAYGPEGWAEGVAAILTKL